MAIKKNTRDTPEIIPMLKTVEQEAFDYGKIKLSRVALVQPPQHEQAAVYLQVVRRERLSQGQRLVDLDRVLPGARLKQQLLQAHPLKGRLPAFSSQGEPVACITISHAVILSSRAILDNVGTGVLW